MKLEIVTPEKVAFSEDVDQVTIPTFDGEITVLPNHVPLVTSLKPGELLAKKSGKGIPLAVGSGFVEIVSDKISVLTDLAEKALEIDEKEVEEIRKRAEEALNNRERLAEEEFALTAATLEKALTQLRIKKKHSSSHRV